MASFRSMEWRGVAKEIAIIVVGVLIALFAQQVADDRDWAKKVRLADAAMVDELTHNDGPQMAQRVALYDCINATLDRIRAAAETSDDRAAIGRAIDGYWIDIRSWDMLALNAASSADIASHMDPARFAMLSEAYQRMPLMERTNAQEAVDWARLKAFRRTGGTITPDERDRLVQAVEALRAGNRTMARSSAVKLSRIREIGKVDPNRMRLFLDDARPHYGACVPSLSTLQALLAAG